MKEERSMKEESSMKVRSICLGVLSFWSLNVYGVPISVNLGTADSFAILAGSTVTNTGPTTVFGNLGLWPGTSVTGFPPGIVSGGTIEAGNATASQAQNDLTTAYNFAAGQTCGTNLTGQDLGSLTLTTGVYCFSSSAGLTGTLTLDAQGDPNALFLFQMGSTLTTASSSAVAFVNGGQGGSVFWQVGSSATLGTNSQFAGSILALTSITLTTGVDIPCGRALARNGAVTMDTNDVSINQAGCGSNLAAPVPEPGTAGLLSVGLLFCLMGYRRHSRKKAT